MEIEKNRMKSIYDNNYIETPKEYFKKCIELLPKFNSLIDIGCANGSFLNYINSLYPDKNLVGIDSNFYNCERRNYKFINKDFVNNNLKLEKKDVITCMGVLSGYGNIELFFKSLFKLLNFGGTMIIFDNVNLINFDFNIKYRESLDKNFIDKYYSYWYCKDTFQKISEKFNMKCEFIPFEIPFKIEKNDDAGRAYTKEVNNIHKQFVYNDFPINFNFIKYTFKSMPIMFHHFKDNKIFNNGINIDTFERFILNIGKENILDYDEWINLYNNNDLPSNKFCLTFDDGLLSQFVLAFPILKKYKIRACWSIITSTLTSGNLYIENLKIIEKEHFKTSDDFLSYFKNYFKKEYDIDLAKNYRNDVEFYNNVEREIRYLRDKILTVEEINIFIDDFKNKNNVQFKRMFINEEELKELIENNQIIANHTHNHRTDIESLDYNTQYYEYSQANKILKKYCNNIESTTCPCGFYNNDSSKIFNHLGLKNILGINSFIKRYDIYNLIS